MGTISVSLPSDGQTIDAADYNTPINTIVSEINGNLNADNLADDAVPPAKWTNPYCFKIYRNAAFNVTGGSGSELLPFDTVEIDTNSNTTIASSKWTAPVSGIYFIVAHAGLDNLDDGGQLALYIYRNGTTSIGNSKAVSSGPSLDPTAEASTMVALTAGDEITTQIDSTVTEALTAGANYSYMLGFLVHST